MQDQHTKRYDVAVVGAGPAGLASAILSARAGLATVLVSPAGLPDDRRTTALLGGSVDLMRSLGVWDDLVARGEVVDVMRLVDDTGRLIRAPEATFEAREIDLPFFGANVPNIAILDVLGAAAAATSNLTRREARVAGALTHETHVALTLEGGETLEARVAVAADGRRSMLRATAGIKADEWTYPQSAMVMNVETRFAHDRICTEFHGPNGPFVLVPLPGKAVSMVLLETPETIDRLNALDDAALALELERRAHSLLGRFTLASQRQVYPLSGLLARRFASRRVMLVGEAAHAFPPVGAQGLNLGLRDVAHLGEVLAQAGARGQDPGADAATDAYDRKRQFDVKTRTFGVDLADRALLSNLLPVQLARAAGLSAVTRLPFLRKLVMREGMVPTLGAPRVMRRA